MENLVILNELQKQYGLKDNEVMILKVLASSKKKLSAVEISKQTEIPMGRMYDFLNELLSKKLIDKTNAAPATYYIDNFEQKVLDFLNFQFEAEKKKTFAVTSLLEQQKQPVVAGIKVVHTNEEVILELIKQSEMGKFFKVLLLGHSVPYFMYPENKEGFTKMRSLVVAKRGALTGVRTQQLHVLMNDAFNRRHRENKKSEFIISKESVNIFLRTLEENYGKKFAQEHLKWIKNRMKAQNIYAKVLDDDFPYYISTNDKCFILSARSGEEIVGITFEGAEGARKLSSRLFDQLFADGEDLVVFLDRYLKSTK